MNTPVVGRPRFATLFGGLIVCMLCLVCLLCMAVAVSATPPPTVDISAFAFKPERMEVSVGTTVTWVNHDESPHTVVARDLGLKSPALDTGEKFSFRFTTPGTYSYYCTLHPKMVGWVIVK
jgi:plastocyanin